MFLYIWEPTQRSSPYAIIKRMVVFNFQARQYGLVLWLKAAHEDMPAENM